MEPKPWPEVSVSNQDYKSAAVIIVGAGFGGLCQAIELIKNNIHNFVILERGSNVGGTWLDNKYPGCQCDIWSVLYSYSFEQNSGWTREYPGQQELLDYLISIAAKYGLFKYCRFNSTVESATWNDETRQWDVAVRNTGEKDKEYGDAYTITSDFLVSAVGQLNQPKYPDIEGLDTFEGKIQHSARWDWCYDIKDKRIAMIGNGATAVQIAPELAKEASHLTVHQRSPNWIVTRGDGPTSQFRRNLFAYAPFFQHRYRSYYMDGRESVHSFLIEPEGEWNRAFRNDCLSKLQKQFPDDPELRQKLTPAYHVGAKRILVSDDYYPTLARPNTTLNTDPIVRITPHGITTRNPTTNAETTSDIDLLVLATGFKTTQFMHPIRITGRNGKPLAQIWEKGSTAYNGVVVADLPNFGMMYGPNTNLGHSSIIIMLESQARYIGGLVSAVLSARHTWRQGSNVHQTTPDPSSPNKKEKLALVVKPSVVQAWDTEIQTRLSKSVFADERCTSWYREGTTGRITNNWPGNCVEYQKRLERVVWGDFEGGEEVQRMTGGEKERKVGRAREEIFVPDGVLISLVGVGIAVAGWAGWFLRTRGVAGGLGLVRGK